MDTEKSRRLRDQHESQKEKADIDAPIVFVGYGIKAPEYGWDDYKGVDLKAKWRYFS